MCTVGFIGTGNMGGALIRGMSELDGVSAVVGFDPNSDLLAELDREVPGFSPAASVVEVAERSDYVVLAVKPQLISNVLEDLAPALDQSKCLLSVVAGVRMNRLKVFSSDVCPVVRIMPNTPALVGEGVYAVCLEDPNLGREQADFVRETFEALGQVHVLAEKDFDAFTAVAGSGPAYVFYFMEAIIEAGVAMGLPRRTCVEMVQGLFTGSAKLAATSGMSPGELREMVSSPAGTTIEALIHLDRNAVRGHVIDAIRACCRRSIELGRE